jgi:hypothetical protein
VGRHHCWAAGLLGLGLSLYIYCIPSIINTTIHSILHGIRGLGLGFHLPQQPPAASTTHPLPTIAAPGRLHLRSRGQPLSSQPPLLPPWAQPHPHPFPSRLPASGRCHPPAGELVLPPAGELGSAAGPGRAGRDSPSPLGLTCAPDPPAGGSHSLGRARAWPHLAGGREPAPGPPPAGGAALWLRPSPLGDAAAERSDAGGSAEGHIPDGRRAGWVHARRPRPPTRRPDLVQDVEAAPQQATPVVACPPLPPPDPAPASAALAATPRCHRGAAAGVVQGRGGLVLGSLIPCALFYSTSPSPKCGHLYPPSHGRCSLLGSSPLFCPWRHQLLMSQHRDNDLLR